VGAEIERKFLVARRGWNASRGRSIRQGYLPVAGNAQVRVRLEEGEGTLTLKSSASGLTRDEYEYALPPAEAEALLRDFCTAGLVEKTRFVHPEKGLTWEVDVFHGENDGLVIVEVELPGETSAITPPDWVGREITGEERYANENLARQPFSRWEPES
jgi:adenylate cyclase